jgi:hypothetical protein
MEMYVKPEGVVLTKMVDLPENSYFTVQVKWIDRWQAIPLDS